MVYLGNPYLKILDLAKLLVMDALMKKKNQKFSVTPEQEQEQECSPDQISITTYFKYNQKVVALLNMGLKTTHGWEG